MRHLLTNKSAELLTADCAVCGPNTPVQYRPSRNQYRCLNKIKEDSAKYERSGKRPRKTTNNKIGRGHEPIVPILLEKQNNNCAICGEPFVKTPHVDHDHQTGQIRGLLCHLCNPGLGFFRDNPAFLLAAVQYLQDAAR